eukprot:SAG31_NODE_694_length_12769_cov_8.102447_15_plen_174_part_00
MKLFFVFLTQKVFVQLRIQSALAHNLTFRRLLAQCNSDTCTFMYLKSILGSSAVTTAASKPHSICVAIRWTQRGKSAFISSKVSTSTRGSSIGRLPLASGFSQDSRWSGQLPKSIFPATPGQRQKAHLTPTDLKALILWTVPKMRVDEMLCQGLCRSLTVGEEFGKAALVATI